MSSSPSTDPRSARRRTFYVENLGCAKNQVDAEVMIAALERAGWARALDPDDADTILVNTCGFIEPAKEESITTTLGFIEAYPRSRVVMTGCLSQRYPEELAAEIPELAGVFGNRAPARVPEFLADLDAGGERVRIPSAGLEAHERTHLLSFPGSAFVKVSEGCDNRCSFCAIPLIRGSHRSKPMDAILAEVEALLDRGVVEINLVAQDLASYGKDLPEATPDELLRRISTLPGDFWVRLLYVYPERFPESFFPILRADPRLLPYFDIPFQHASTKVLRGMGRPGDAERYLSLVRRIREELPDAVIRSTLLVGFFGETDEAFDELLSFQQQADLDWLGVFPYSPEEGTPATRGNPRRDVSPKLAERRARAVEERQREITERRMDRFVGRDLDVLVEELVPEEPLAIGRCYAQAPEVDGAVVVHVPEEELGADGGAAVAHATARRVVPGRLVRCRIVKRNGLDLEAVPL
ncbi:MAG: 30S ribosomal protein S12 methylthiotransferase RimO [bacterium]